MNKYEYLVSPVEMTDIPKEMIEDSDVLTELGEKGWELVSVAPITVKGTTERGLAFLKRLKE